MLRATQPRRITTPSCNRVKGGGGGFNPSQDIQHEVSGRSNLPRSNVTKKSPLCDLNSPAWHSSPQYTQHEATKTLVYQRITRMRSPEVVLLPPGWDVGPSQDTTQYEIARSILSKYKPTVKVTAVSFESGLLRSQSLRSA